ncbi:hypothetical protein CDD83_10270 [Cordyceps sp. RAO-2017]|nr:hypothetical protein CDD83_10270 [Cordyceps sp. RAO-2017]
MGLVDAILGHVSLASVALFVVSALVVRHVVQRVDEHQRITRLGGYAPSIKPCWAPLGIDFIVRGFRAQLRDQTYDFWRNGFFARADAWTVETRVVGQRALFTADPDNIKAMLSTQFGDFGKGQPFHDEWEAFLGDGIFATDGALWQASRQLIRPQFTRDRVSDLDCFESHVQTLFAVMAKAEAAPAGQTATRHKPPASVPSSSRGRVVEMTDLFYRFTLDVTTDFLLGADVKSLTSSEQGFANAWDEVQLLQCLINRTFAFGRLLPMPRFHACLGVVNNFVNTFIDRVLGLAPDELAAKDEGG